MNIRARVIFYPTIDKFNQNLDVMKILVKNAIEVYNNKRPHYSNYMLTPNQMHQQNIVEMRTYKSKAPVKKVLTGA